MKINMAQLQRAGPLKQALIVAVFLSATFLSNLKFGPRVIEGASSGGWPTVAGVVLSSEVTWEIDDGTTMYDAKVRYGYSVDGQSFESDRISVGSLASSLKHQAAERVKRYSEGKEVVVHYNPSHPGEAVLEAGIDAGTAVIFCVIIAFNAVSLVLMVSVFSTWRGKTQRLVGESGGPLAELVRNQDGAYVRLTNTGDAFALTLWFVAYAAAGVAFVLGIPTMVFEWPGWVPLTGLGLVACTVPFRAMHLRNAQKGHENDLRVDFENGWVLLPRNPGTTHYEPVAFSSIVGVSAAPNTDYPGHANILLEFIPPGEDYSQTTPLVPVDESEAREIVARIEHHLAPLIRKAVNKPPQGA